MYRLLTLGARTYSLSLSTTDESLLQEDRKGNKPDTREREVFSKVKFRNHSVVAFLLVDMENRDKNM